MLNRMYEMSVLEVRGVSVSALKSQSSSKSQFEDKAFNHAHVYLPVM